jgi:hypothetical protein
MGMKAAFILIFVCAWLIQGRKKAVDPVATRQEELASILKPLLTPEAYPFWDDEAETGPGWYKATNRQTLKLFIAKYPETEESYQASIWLAFASAYTEKCPIPSKEKRRVTDLTDRLKMVIQRTSQHGTERMAKLELAFRLYGEEPEDHTDFYGQVNDILNHINEFESEKDAAFRRYLKVRETRPSEIEPTLRLLVVNEKCCDHQLDNALSLAKELKQKFPNWEQQSVNGAIEMMELYKRGWTPSNSIRHLSEN